MLKNPSLVRRAALALILMISFYALALFVAGALAWLAYADMTLARRPNGRLILFCVIGAGSVLWAIIPRPDRFEDPGPRITAHDHPELFKLIQEVAKATGQERPHDVYLVNDVNAFVSQRGGVMGFGSRRVMGLGLPLMQALTVDEFKGVLAHEFGHYHSGDVALGPWIHKTRAAIGRTLEQLSESVLRYIFYAYGTLFLRVTHAVSRRQEFIADEIGAGVAGANAMISGLRKLGGVSFAYQGFWYSELSPVMQAGYVPPIMAGFATFMERPRITAMMSSVSEREEKGSQTDPYDTHPSLAERVAALEMQPTRGEFDTRPASTLLTSVAEWERRTLATLNPEFTRLKPIDWAGVTTNVYVPMWRERIEQDGELLNGYTLGEPPRTQEELLTIGRGILKGAAAEDVEQCLSAAWQLIIAAFCLTLAPVGWSAETLPGDEVVLRKGNTVLRPWSELRDVMEGKTALADWKTSCALIGIDALPLRPTLAAGLAMTARVD
jgi:Zn-dependent protease with chaperone function